MIAESQGNSNKFSEDGSNPEGLQLVLNYTTGETKIYASGMKWFENADVIVHRNQNIFSQSNGTLQMSSAGPISIEGKDIIGDFVGMDISWSGSFETTNNQVRVNPKADKFLVTQARSYGNDVIAFSQIFFDGLQNASLGSGAGSVNRVGLMLLFLFLLCFSSDILW